VELIDQRVHPEDVASFRQIVERAAKDGQDYSQEYRLRMPDGRIKHIHVVANATRNETGGVDFVGAVMDVTLAKGRGQDSIPQASASSSSAVAPGGEMERSGARRGIATISNNVLAGVFAYGEMLFEETPEDSPLKRYAKNVLTGRDSRAGRWFEQILAFSRSQLGKRVTVDVTHVVAETLELLRGCLPANIGLDRARRCASHRDRRCHPVDQVVMNVCSNAIQAMSATGTLRVALEAADLCRRASAVARHAGAGSLRRLTIQDSGSGMDQATLARILRAVLHHQGDRPGHRTRSFAGIRDRHDAGGAIDVRAP